MRTLYFDEYEFDPVDSEQSLALAISKVGQHTNLAKFALACEARINGTKPPTHWPRWADIARNVQKLGAVTLPPLERCNVEVLVDEWNDLEVLVETLDLFVWYHWSTTA